jgi:hypothetical protein
MTDPDTITEPLPLSRSQVLRDIRDLLNQVQAQLSSVDLMTHESDEVGVDQAFHVALDAVSNRLAMIDKRLDLLAELAGTKAA